MEAQRGFVSRKRETCVHVMDKCIRQTDIAGLHPVSFSTSASPVPFWKMHHPMALTHELAVERLWIYCLMS